MIWISVGTRLGARTCEPASAARWWTREIYMAYLTERNSVRYQALAPE